MVEVQFFIPLADNERVDFDAKHHKQFEKRLTHYFPSGWTLLPSEAVGQWKEKGIVYPDRHRISMVAVEGLLVSAGTILRLVQFAAKHYRQKAIYVRYLGASEIISGK
jgi:hypothetical protein